MALRLLSSGDRVLHLVQPNVATIGIPFGIDVERPA
jgi:hypothetical protein